MPSTAHPSHSPLLRRLISLTRAFRAAGIPATPSDAMEIARSLAYVDLGSVDDVRETVRCIVMKRPEDRETFDLVWAAFWRARESLQLDTPGEPLNGDTGDLSRPGRGPRQGMGRADLDLIDPEDAGGDAGENSYSAGELLRARDFGTLTREELVEARRFIAAMRWNLALRPSARTHPAATGQALDVRASLRSSLRHGGELFDLKRRRPRTRHRRLVLLCDISGSMERYTRLLLHFLHSIQSGMDAVEVFVFGTRLSRITHDLRHRDADQALNRVSTHVEDWSGGTRIGASLREFNLRWARRVLGQGAIVLIISDGWDRGDPALLGAQMARLQRSSYRLLWLNPLLGDREYQPLTRGMQAALPYIDDFLPVHNLNSLEDLGALLAGLRAGRPARRSVRAS